MKPFAPIQIHASPIFGMVYPLQHENEAFFSHTNAYISHFWHGLLSLSSMKMKLLSPIQIHASPFLRWFTGSLSGAE
jgi:hypothetical protein